MKIYLLESDVSKYKWIHPVNEDDWDIIGNIDGSIISKGWKSIDLEFINKLIGDFPNLLSGAIVISKKAKDIIEPIIGNNSEFLTVRVLGEYSYLIMNVLNQNDWLDKAKSSYKSFSDGRIRQINNYVFFEDKLREDIIFRLSAYRCNIYVTDKFINIIKENNLKGLKFVEVWPKLDEKEYNRLY